MRWVDTNARLLTATTASNIYLLCCMDPYPLLTSRLASPERTQLDFSSVKCKKHCYRVHIDMDYRKLTSGTRLDLFVDVKASCARDTRLLNVAGANPGGTSVTFHLRKDRRASSHF